MEVEGHAGLGEPGSDILCAAVSALTENLGLSLKYLLNIPVEIEEREGYYRIKLSGAAAPDTEKIDKADLLFSSVLLGLGRLAEQHPDRIKIETGD